MLGSLRKDPEQAVVSDKSNASDLTKVEDIGLQEVDHSKALDDRIPKTRGN